MRYGPVTSPYPTSSRRAERPSNGLRRPVTARGRAVLAESRRRVQGLPVDRH
ncbi:MAG TPA: hypothetical protein VE570_01780 [Thermoleophilaceae bacterium]|nr:hypothetical protein [Thermoleophilaceae bacterium]